MQLHLYWSSNMSRDSASVLVLGCTCYQFIGQRALLLKDEDAVCVHFSLDRLNTAPKSPLCLCACEACRRERVYLCFSSFLPQDVYKVLIDRLLGTASPSVPTGPFCGMVNLSSQTYRDHFSIRVDLSSRVRREAWGLYRCPIWTCRVTIPGIEGGNIKLSVMCRARVKESRPSVCHWNAGVIFANRNIPVSSSESDRCPAAACQRPKQPLCLWWLDAGITTMLS